MPVDDNFPFDPTPKTSDQVLADLLRETERLRREVADLRTERDQYRRLYLEEAAENDPELTAEDIANSVSARPVIDAMIEELARR
jgi:hypothetical protein